jgi:hypothetical protein
MTAAKLRHIGGSKNDNFNVHIANSVMATVWCTNARDAEARSALIGAVTKAVSAFAPQDEIEGMIAAQAVAFHYASMECSRRAMLPDQGFEATRECRKAAANASRTFVELLSALDRKRGKGGQQKVTVEHVHVHAGGKAIVGAVAPSSFGPEGGGGADQKWRGEPDAPPAALEHDVAAGPSIPPVRGADAQRHRVPVARDDERPLPDARRRQHRAEDG